MIVRALGVSLLMAVSQAAQPPLDLCAENSQSGRERHCEVREEILTGQTALDVDPGRNGGVHVRGWSRQDVRLRTRVEGLRRRRVARARARCRGPSDDAGGTASDRRPDGARQRALGDVVLSRCAGEHAACDQHEQRRHLSRGVQRRRRSSRVQWQHPAARGSGQISRDTRRMAGFISSSQALVGKGRVSTSRRETDPSVSRCPPITRQNSKRVRCTAACRSTFPRQSIQAASAGSPRRWDREGRRFERLRRTGRWSCSVNSELAFSLLNLASKEA